MAFTPEPGRTADGIGNIVVILKDAVAVTGLDPEPAYQSGHFQIIIEFDDGSTKQRRGNLENHITPAERTALLDFMTTLRARAATQILPP